MLGRYVPGLNFLSVLIGDEPVLPPEACYYQRLLALDEDEAQEIVKKYLHENTLEDLYGSVLVPALSAALGSGVLRQYCNESYASAASSETPDRFGRAPGGGDGGYSSLGPAESQAD